MVDVAYTQGFTKRAIEVKWATGEKIAVVEFSYSCQWHRPIFVLSGFYFTADTLQVETTPIEYVIPGGAFIPPAIVNPFTDDMMKKVYWWDRHTFTRSSSDNVNACDARWFFNLGLIKKRPPPGVAAADYTSFTFKISQPAGTFINQDGSVYWVWDDMHNPSFADAKDNPYTLGSPFTCPGTYCEPSGFLVLPRAFPTSTEAGNWAAAFNAAAVGVHMVVEVETTPDTLPDNLSWTTRISTYPKPPDKKRRNFPSDPPDTVDLDWNVNTESKFHANTSGDWPSPTSPIVARDIIYTVNFSTLAVTIT